METAISAGERAPIERPTGPLIRAISSGEKPAEIAVAILAQITAVRRAGA